MYWWNFNFNKYILCRRLFLRLLAILVLLVQKPVTLYKYRATNVFSSTHWGGRDLVGRWREKRNKVKRRKSKRLPFNIIIRYSVATPV
ncbi:hypothetical protein F5B22DRAFT_266210 [Xylaria bambusicola]|uniref:uncharacterized protein n=1 Tax=Xylaria bambusicola TaxID=326684 RepID=UPI0020087A60|nr:uncharacterized protein F5B22DRAFT_266210 [Xylaria bambusicola]KAI0526052.1 hypothetical protein F5B22DRAFT_266210 [Xylaria bambusicola]